MMRAKMRVVDIKSYTNDNNEITQQNLTFTAVGKSGAYPDDGMDENNTFSRFTPNAELSMSIMNPALFGKFEVGEEFYLDFSKA